MTEGKNIKIIVGVHDNYIKTFFDFLNLLKEINYPINNSLVVYNFGLNDNNFEKIMNYKIQYQFLFKNINFNCYPEYINCNKYEKNALNIIALYNEVNDEENKDLFLLWLDCSCKFNLDSLALIGYNILKQGIFSPILYEAGTENAIKSHSYEYNELFNVSVCDIPLRNMKIVGIDYNSLSGKSILNDLYKSITIRELIYSEDKLNDDSLLSIFIYLFEKKMKYKFEIDVPKGIYFKYNTLDDVKENKKELNIFMFTRKKTLLEFFTCKKEIIEHIFCNDKSDAIQQFSKKQGITESKVEEFYHIN